KEGLCRCTVASLAQVDIHQIPIPIYSTVQVGPPTLHFKIGFVAVPTPAYSPPPVLTEGLIQHGSKFRFPLPPPFMREEHAAVPEHLCEVPQTELVAHAPQHH